MRGEKKGVRLFAMLSLVLPVFLSIPGVSGVLASLLEAFTGTGGDEAIVAFRANLSAELFGALFSVVAFLLLIKCAADREVRNALWLLVLPELYMFYYWGSAFMSPGERAMRLELFGNSLLLLAVVWCCYAWSLLWRNGRLTAKERTWVQFLFLPYVLSFVAFFAPMWQRYIPEGAGNALSPENNPVYMLMAFVINAMRVVGIWFFVNSRLFVVGNWDEDADEEDEEDEAANDRSAMNRCVLGIMLSAFFVINGLALLYRNAYMFIDL